MVTASTGFGSVWNKGNWHWENRNYTEFAKDFLSKQWVAISFSANDAQIEVYEIKELKGSASVTIRKGKQIFLWEFEGELYWRAKGTKIGEAWKDLKCQGKLKMHEFNYEDDEIAVDVTCEQPGAWEDGVRQAVRKQLPVELQKAAQKLIPALQQKDADDMKVEQAKAQAKAAEEGFKEAQLQTGDLKLQLFEEQKKREEEMKRQEVLKAQQQPAPVKKVEVIAGTGSVWNTNSYHWEEKSIGKWADDTLKQTVSQFTYKFNDATLFVTEIKEFKGEASMSVRKGKKIVQFDYHVTMQWKVSFADKDGREISFCSGTYEWPEICSEESFDAWECRVVYLEDKDQLRGMLDQMIRNLAPKELKKTINEKFVEELKKK